MSKKSKPNSSVFVYSTNPDFQIEDDGTDQQETLLPSEQNLRIQLETKHRAGKTVTVITGFKGKTGNAEMLGKQLKNLCGTGGSVKDAEIIIQGDHREKVLQYLLKSGYSKTKKSGG